MTNIEQIIRWNELKGLVKLGRSTIWRLEKRGDFPHRRQLSPGAVGWLQSEVDAWLQSRQVV